MSSDLQDTAWVLLAKKMGLVIETLAHHPEAIETLPQRDIRIRAWAQVTMGEIIRRKVEGKIPMEEDDQKDNLEEHAKRSLEVLFQHMDSGYPVNTVVLSEVALIHALREMAAGMVELTLAIQEMTASIAKWRAEDAEEE